ncbi:DUF1700 domain-containing protein [Massilia sp. TS11]|uniref:DUF1700 domain-containing protein n=1 Tax=Massilia sp. TS11 TaxID=2908003 RepID=UPI001EDB591E|nr:DUF1700 domain-containing protein [Massilia sp. TS11]MCG2584663.1 DUF1700 domain-containing protein [Massilia sp. TS11]
MNKQQYLDALRAALAGLPAETVAKTLAYYEQRFVDGVAGGQSEESIAAGLDEPRKIAMTLRASSHLSDLQKKPRPINPLRMLVSAVGLAIFNLFMVVPGMVYASLVAALYACAIGFYACGIVVTASGLAAVNHVVINTPLHYVISDDESERVGSTQTHVSISSEGVHISPVPVEEVQENDPGRSRVFDRAERTAIGPVEISTELDPEARTTQTFVGFGLMIGGILLSLLSVVVTRYTLIGLKRYVEMNFNILRGQ